MDWVKTADNLIFASVHREAQIAFPELSNSDWHQVCGDRDTFVEKVAAYRDITLDAADHAVAALESSLNYKRFSF